jgi:uncharacterized membrane protein
MDEGNTKSWRVTLTPHRSLSRRGFLAVMTAIALINLVIGLSFYLLGAWPVVGFCGLDVALMWWAFKANFADGRRAERIEISEHEVILERLAEGRERQEKRFVRRWVRVELEEDRDRELIGGLFLYSHGSRTEIGSFLSPHERQALAGALRGAIASPRI